MSLWKNQLVLQYKDANGKLATSFWTMQDQTPAVLGALADVVNAAQAMSDATIVAAYVSRVVEGTAPVGAGPYKTVYDKANIRVRSSAGTYGQLRIAGPKETVFLADHKTVDFSDPLVAAFVTALQANLGDSIGTPWTSVTGGVRQRVTVPSEA